MEYVRKNIPLWSITIWDKKINNVEKEWQPKVKKYKYLLADELDSIKAENGDIRILYTGKDTGFTTEELAGDAIAEGEVVTIPWGGIPTVKYHKGKFVTGDNRIATSSDTSLLTNKYLYYFMKGNTDTIASFYRGASLKHPSMRDVLKMCISFPSVEEQNRIVQQFDRLEKLIELRQQELQKLDELIKARFVEMFVCKNYPRITLDELSLGKGEYGAQSASTEYDANRPRYVRITDINEDGTLNDDYVCSENCEDDKLYKLSYGDFMFARMGATVGKTYAYKTGNQIFAGYLIRYRLNLEKILPEYLYAYTKLEEYKNWVKVNQSGAAQPGINAKKIWFIIDSSSTIRRAS